MIKRVFLHLTECLNRKIMLTCKGWPYLGSDDNRTPCVTDTKIDFHSFLCMGDATRAFYVSSLKVVFAVFIAFPLKGSRLADRQSKGGRALSHH